MSGTPWAFHAATFGCKVNQYETQALREAWLARGCTEVDTPAEADVLLVNSCAVTARAVTELRQTVKRLHRDAPAARIVITGCAAQILGKELEDLPGVVSVVPQEAKTSLRTYDPAAQGSPKCDSPESGSSMCDFSKPDSPQRQLPGHELLQGDSPAPDSPPLFPDFSIKGFRRARPVVKVQDGCSHRCTYCIVPLARGASRSRETADIMAELRRLLEAGHREITLSGVNLRQYGRDLASQQDFWDLLARIEREFGEAWHGRARLRLSSLEPGQLGTKALDVLGASRLVCPHLHISLQSGSASVLRRMGRGHYSPAPLLDFLQALGGIWPVYGLGADILMGFPGESESEYEETRAFVLALPLTYAHVFPYSRRPGTIAAGMAGQVSRELKKLRAAAVREIVTEKKDLFIEQMATFPRLDVMLDAHGAKKGVSQYYVECKVRGIERGQGTRDLLAVRPVGVERGAVVAVPVDGN